MKKLFLILLLLFLIPLNCWAVTEFTCTVIPAGGGDYSSLSAWEAAINCNLTISSVTAGGLTRGAFADGVAITQTTTGATGTSLHDTTTQMLIITISGSPNSTDTWYPTADENDTTNAWTPSGSYDTARVTANCSGATADTTAVVIYGWTTNSTHYIQINGDNTTGKASTTKYRLVFDGQFRIYINDVTIKNIEFILSTGYIYPLASSAAITIDSCIIHGGGYGICCNATAGTITLINNIIYACSSYGIAQGDANNITAYNNTLYGNSRGINATGANGTKTLKNNICYNNGAADYNLAGTLITSNNLSKDNTSPDADYRSKTLTFINTGAGTENFHLVSGDTDAIDKGTDLSANFTTDIDGDTRTGTWDIGADEYVAPPSAQPVGYGVIFVY